MSDPRGAASPRASRWGPVIGWACLILVLTSWPNPDLGPQAAGTDKLAHFAVYAVLGALIARALRPSPAAATRALAVLAVAGFALMDELHQLFIPGRSASAGDWSADLLGAVVGLLAGLHLLSLARARQDLPT